MLTFFFNLKIGKNWTKNLTCNVTMQLLKIMKKGLKSVCQLHLSVDSDKHGHTSCLMV